MCCYLPVLTFHMFYLSTHFTPLPIFLNIFLPIYSYYRFYLSNCFTHLSFLPDNSFTPLLVYPFAFCQYTRITRFIHQTVLPIYRLYRTTCLLHYLLNPSNHFTYVTVLPVLLFYPFQTMELAKGSIMKEIFPIL